MRDKRNGYWADEERSREQREIAREVGRRVGRANKGSNLSEETKQNLREKMVELHQDEEYKEKWLESLLRGPDNPAWIDGRSFEPYPPEFNTALKLKIRTRDHFTCQKCGIAEEESKQKWGEVLSINHIDYNKQNIEEYNLISLCKSCNGKVNSNRPYWQAVFVGLMVEGGYGDGSGN